MHTYEVLYDREEIFSESRLSVLLLYPSQDNRQLKDYTKLSPVMLF